MRDAAEKRDGVWEVTTHDWVVPVGGVSHWLGKKELQATKVKFGEKEIPRVLHIFQHGQRNKTKPETIYANLEQAAESMWPTGSLEHVALRFLAVPLLVRAFAGHKVPKATHGPFVATCLSAAMFGVVSHLIFPEVLTTVGVVAVSYKILHWMLMDTEYAETQLLRCDDQPGGASSHSDGEKTKTKGADGKGPKGDPKDTNDPKNADAKGPKEGPTNNKDTMTWYGAPDTSGDKSPQYVKELVKKLPSTPKASAQKAEEFFIGDEDKQPDPAPLRRTDSTFVCPSSGLPLHGGNTPEDAEIIANEQERVVEKNGIKMIVGQDFDGEDKDTKQIVGVLTAPTPTKPNVYNNTSRNAEAAIRERLIKKARPYTGTSEDEKKIKKLVGEATGTKDNRAIFATKHIRKWAEEFFHLDLVKSGKWSSKRMEDSLNNLHKQAYPSITLKCSVKLEPMAEGKPPRLLIADGDDGQLMALIVVKCFEDLLFRWFENKSIKHAGKRAAIKRTVKNLTKPGARLVEGDGSAWDTTCNAEIRDSIENPCLKHILQVLVPYGVVPEQWHREHVALCEKRELKIFFTKKLDKMKCKIDAIRRSGHRGTSCLNWWINFVNWSCSIFKQPERFLDPKIRNGLDETGHERWWNGAFEGDDSLCALKPPMKEGDAMDKYFLAWWERQGFNMKIIYADKRATFCGYHIVCKEGEPTGFSCPELPRALVGAGVSTSSTIIQAAKDGNEKVVRDIAAAGALARAADFAGLLPRVSRKFYDYAKSIKCSTEVMDREMSMRVMGEEGHHFSSIEQTIESQNLLVTPTEEFANLQALLCPATWVELDKFTLHPWNFENIGEFETHMASLPMSWRPPSK